MSREELDAITDTLSDIAVRAEWSDEARYAIARFNAAAERERALLDAARAASSSDEAVATELEIALRGAAAQYRDERARLLGRYDLRPRGARMRGAACSRV